VCCKRGVVVYREHGELAKNGEDFIYAAQLLRLAAIGVVTPPSGACPIPAPGVVHHGCRCCSSTAIVGMVSAVATTAASADTSIMAIVKLRGQHERTNGFRRSENRMG